VGSFRTFSEEKRRRALGIVLENLEKICLENWGGLEHQDRNRKKGLMGGPGETHQCSRKKNRRLCREGGKFIINRGGGSPGNHKNETKPCLVRGGEVVTLIGIDGNREEG